jgi:Ca2+/H+ antiporter, TMEM165/GDT1 family
MDWTTLLSTFGLLFVAELGDKTQLVVISQTCKHRRAWPVFLGGALALTAVTGVGVAFGRLVAMLVPALLMKRIAAAAFVLMGLYILFELIRSRGEAASCPTAEPACDAAENRRRNWIAFSSTFALLFVAEMGDKTQLAALSMATEAPSPWPVFIGGSLALTLVTALGVVFGQGLCKIIPERALKLVSAGAFIVIGGLMWLGVF